MTKICTEVSYFWCQGILSTQEQIESLPHSNCPAPPKLMCLTMQQRLSFSKDQLSAYLENLILYSYLQGFFFPFLNYLLKNKSTVTIFLLIKLRQPQPGLPLGPQQSSFISPLPGHRPLRDQGFCSPFCLSWRRGKRSWAAEYVNPPWQTAFESDHGVGRPNSNPRIHKSLEGGSVRCSWRE